MLTHRRTPPWPIAIVALLMTLMSTPAAAQDQGGPWGDDGYDSDAEVDSDGAVTVALSIAGAVGEPAVTVTFDGEGRAVVTSNLAPVEVREIDSVPPQDRNDVPHFQGACIRTITMMVIEGQEAATVLAYEEAMRFAIRSIFPGQVVTIPDCPPVPADQRGDPVQALEDLVGWAAEQLPRPTPVVNPSTAITGLDTYLQTNRELAWGQVDTSIALGGTSFPVRLWAEGAYMVDWGQQDAGEGPAFERVTGPHTIPGRNYESGRSHDDGAVTHVYTSTPDGPLTVSVTDYWLIHYTIPGVVTDAAISAELEAVTVPVEVAEYQAVVIDQ